MQNLYDDDDIWDAEWFDDDDDDDELFDDQFLQKEKSKWKSKLQL